MEGKFAGEGLQSIDEDDDMLSAMARELVERNGIGESADAVWKALHDQHQRLFSRDLACDDVGLSETVNVQPESKAKGAELIAGAFGSGSLLILGRKPSSLSKRSRARPPIPEQPSLFGETDPIH
jgi:hypothetical protein